MQSFKRLDKIVVHQKDIVDIQKWVREQDFQSISIPLHEGSVILQGLEIPIEYIQKDMGIYFKFDEDAGVVSLKAYDIEDESIMLEGRMNLEHIDDSDKLVEVESKYADKMGQKSMTKLGMSLFLIVSDVFQYITNREQYVKSREEVSQVRKPVKKKRKTGNRKARYVKIKTTRYEVSNTPQQRTYERHMNAWSVRGHWRYYKKTGKRVWIQGHTRGEGKPDSKIYKI